MDDILKHPLEALLLVGGLVVGAKALKNEAQNKIEPIVEGYKTEDEKIQKKKAKKEGKKK